MLDPFHAPQMSPFFLAPPLGDLSRITAASFSETDTIVFPGEAPETWTLDRPMPVAYSVTGQPLIRTTQDFNIVAASSAPAVDVEGRAFNGFMDTPRMVGEGALQGFDQYAAENVVKNTQVMPYGDNVPLPITISTNSSGTLVQGIRNDTLPTTAGFSKYLMCTLVEADRFVPEGFFSPAYNDPSAEILLTESSAVWSYQSLPELSTFDGANRLDAEAAIPANRFLSYCGNDAEKHRRMMVTEQGGYARDWSVNFGPSGLFLHSEAPREEKRDVWLRRVQAGLDAYGLIANEGYEGQFGAGQYTGMFELLMDFAFAAGDQDIMSACVEFRTNVLDQPFYITAEHLRESPQWPDSNGNYNWIFQEGQVGMPHWNSGGAASSQLSGSLNSRYSGVFKAPALFSAMSIGLMRNGAVTGYNVLRDRGGQVLDYIDQIAWSDAYNDGSGVNAVPNGLRETYRQVRDRIGPVATNSKPWPSFKEFAAAGDGEISIDFSDVLGSNSVSPVTEVQAFISQDGGISGQIIDVALDGDGLITVPAVAKEHLVRTRFRNESGWSFWSYNFPRTSRSPTTGLVTPSDTGVDRPPTLITPAAIMEKVSPHPSPLYRPLPAEAKSNVVSYVLGHGYVDMKPVVEPSVQWYNGDPASGGAPIPGETGVTLVGDAQSYQGYVLYARMIWDNGIGNLVQDVGPIPVGSATYGIMQPSSETFSLSNLRHIWDNGDTSFQLDPENVLPLRVTQGGSAHAARLIDLGSLEIAGDVTSDMPEGDLVVLTAAYSGGTDVVGIVLRASGDDQASADGYGVDIYFKSDRAEFMFATITSGAVARDRINVGSDTEEGVDQAPGSGEIWTRVNWREENGDFVVRVRVWPDDRVEASEWDYVYTFPGPIKSGTRMGLGVTDQDAGRRYGGLAVSLDPDQPAPLTR